MDIEAQKRAAAARAVEFVRPGMRIGLGTGSTARHFVELLAERVRARPGRRRGADLGNDAPRRRAMGHPADQSRRDAGTRSDRGRCRRDRAGPEPHQGRWRRPAAGEDRRLCVRAADRDRRRVRSGCPRSAGFRCRSRSCRSGSRRPGARSKPRRARPDAPGRRCCAAAKDGHAFVTDNGHWVLDAALERISDPKRLAERLSAIPGVVEHGLFIGLAQAVVLGGPEGVRVVERQ